MSCIQLCKLENFIILQKVNSAHTHNIIYKDKDKNYGKYVANELKAPKKYIGVHGGTKQTIKHQN